MCNISMYTRKIAVLQLNKILAQYSENKSMAEFPLIQFTYAWKSKQLVLEFRSFEHVVDTFVQMRISDTHM